MKTTYLLVLFFSIAALSISCQKEKSFEGEAYTLRLIFQPSANGEPLQLNKEYINPIGEDYTVTTFKFYVSKISLLQELPTPVARKEDGFFLVDAANPASQIIEVQLNANPFNRLMFQIGIDSIYNVSGAQTGALDPMNGMFWTWNSGYIMAKLEGILADPQKVLQVIIDELNEIKERYGDERRSEIVASSGDIDIEDMIVEEDMMVTITHAGYIKRNPVSLYRSQRRGGRGKVGMGTKEEDFVEKIFVASTHHYLLVFTNTGRVHWLKVYQIPQAGRAAKGKAIVNMINMGQGERVSATLPVREFDENKYIVMVTKKGTIKKTELSAYSNPRSGGIIALSLDKGDELVDVKVTTGKQDIFLATRRGLAIRFKEKDVRDMGRTAKGVRGISLVKDDEVVGVEIPEKDTYILTVSEKGFGKSTPIKEYRLQSRGGKGTLNLKIVPKVGNVSGVLQVSGEEHVMLISDGGKVIRLKGEDIPIHHRVAQGVKLIDLEAKEKLVGVALTTSEGGDDENGIEDEGEE